MNKYIFIFAAFALILVGCEDKSSKEISQLKDEVMNVHDEIMPNHGKLVKLEEELENRLENLNENGEADSATVVKYHKAIQHVKDAVSGMDNWMHEWDPNYVKKEKDEAIAYLKDQKKIIEKVKYHFEASEETANELLKNENAKDK